MKSKRNEDNGKWKIFPFQQRIAAINGMTQLIWIKHQKLNDVQRCFYWQRTINFASIGRLLRRNSMFVFGYAFIFGFVHEPTVMLLERLCACVVFDLCCHCDWWSIHTAEAYEQSNNVFFFSLTIMLVVVVMVSLLQLMHFNFIWLADVMIQPFDIFVYWNGGVSGLSCAVSGIKPIFHWLNLWRELKALRLFVDSMDLLEVVIFHWKQCIETIEPTHSM